MPSRSDEPGLVVRESHVRRRDSEPPRHRSKRKKTDDDDRPYKHVQKSTVKSSVGENGRRSSETRRPSIWRRATDTADSTRTKLPMGRKEASKKDPVRHPSSRYIYERPTRRKSLPLRSEKQSASENVTRKIKKPQPLTRSALHHNTNVARLGSASRPPLYRSKTTARKERAIHTSSSSRPQEKQRAQSFAGTSKRSPSLLGSVMSAPRKKPVKQVECVTCLSDFPASEGAHLKECDHYWCDVCLERIFNLSIKDIQHMPPKCCNSKPIQPKMAMHLYKSDFRKRWNAKYAEWSTKDRLYCPHKSCLTWIKPEFIKVDNKGRKIYGKCPRCDRKVCPKCNCKYHPDKKECPDDPETAAFIKTAKDNGWQNCSKCGVTVERTEGCHHMTCPPPCNHEFCILCGAKWKTCECPWFAAGAITEAERLYNEQPHLHQMPGQAPPGPHRAQYLTYEEEMNMRRDQERQDEAFARHLAQMNMDDNDDNDHHHNGGHDFAHQHYHIDDDGYQVFGAPHARQHPVYGMPAAWVLPPRAPQAPVRRVGGDRRGAW